MASAEQEPPRQYSEEELAGTGWVNFADCKGMYDIFLSELPINVSKAKAICDECGVEAECLEYALNKREAFGVWGGMDDAQRRATIRRRQRAARMGRAAAPPA